MPDSSYKNRLKTLIEGYEGYNTTTVRHKTCEIFEAFIREKLRIIQKIVEDKYNEFLRDKKNLYLLIPLSGLIKNTSDAFQYIAFEKKERKFFLNEYRFTDPSTDEKLCSYDYQILQQISIIVDKITHFEDECKVKLEGLSNAILILKKKLSDRKNLMYKINEELVPVNNLINSAMQDIRDRKITEETFKKIHKAIEMYPNRLNTYMDIFHSFHRYSSFYTRVNENIPLLDFFDKAKLFVRKFREYTEILKEFLAKYDFKTDEEIECKNYLEDRLDKMPNLTVIEKEIEEVKKEAEMKQMRRKHEEEIIKKATIEYRKGLRFEKELRYIEAIALYEKTLMIDSKYVEAKEAIERCNKKKKALPAYLKALKKLQIGQKKRAISLLNKALKKAPEFEEAKELLEKLIKEQKEES